MSSPEALAAVTEILQRLLLSADEQENVTAKPPSVARNGESGEQLNIFLYSVHYNPAFRNEPMPGTARNGEPVFPPMPLILKYLITAYGSGDQDIEGQKVMGRAMSILHDHPVLSREELESIESNAGLHQQFERIRITPDTLSLDDMSKLWSSFQSAEYRLSVGYEVSVVLIESSRVARAPVPVFKRGKKDRGVHTLPGPSASLSGLRFPNQKPAAELGDSVILLGQNLTVEDTKAQFRHPLVGDEFPDLPLESLEGGVGVTVTLKLPESPGGQAQAWPGPAGFYTLSLLVEHPDTPKWTSNQLAMPLSPRVTFLDSQGQPVDNKKILAVKTGDTLNIKCRPRILEGQEVILIFSDQMFVVPPDSIDDTSTEEESSSRLTFVANDVAPRPDPYIVRLRVDGVDSIPVHLGSSEPVIGKNKFDEIQQVKIEEENQP